MSREAAKEREERSCEFEKKEAQAPQGASM